MSGQNIKHLISVVSLGLLAVAGLTLLWLARPANAQTSCSLPTDFGSVTQTVKPAAGATYKVWVRLWVPSGKTSSAKLSFNTVCQDLPAPTTIASNSWVWVDKAKDNVTVLQSSLTANVDYTMTIAGQASGVRVDRVLFLSDSCAPTGTGSNCTTTDTTAPTITLTAPLNGQTVSGNVTVTSSISNLSDVSKVELLVNSQSVATSTTSPYNIVWDSRTVADGSYELKTRVTDPSNNTNTSPPITVNVDNVVAPPPSGTTSRIPIDTYNSGGENVGYHDTTSGNLGNGTCRSDDVDLKLGEDGHCVVGWFATGEWLKYNVSIATAGTYTLNANVARGLADAGAFRLEVGSTNATGTVSVPSTNSWSVFATVSDTITLPAGDHTLRLYNEKEYFDIAWLDFIGPGTVTLKAQTPPPPPPPANVTSFISIDTYNNGGENVGYHDTTPGNLGSGTCRNDDVDLKPAADGHCILGYFATNEWLKYDVSIAAAGSYTFQVNAARGLADNGRLRLEVDGTDVSGDVLIPATGSWTSFTVVNATVNLPAGDHTLRLYNELEYFDVSWLQFIGPGTVTLKQQTPPPPPPDTTAPSQPTGLVASAVAQTSLTLSWQPSTDTGTGVVGYAVYRNGVLLEAVVSPSFSDSGLTPDTTYTYQVSALDGAGNESPKTSLSVTTLEVPTTPPPSDVPSADINGDGQYDQTDRSLYKNLYRAKSPEADFDQNGIIDIRDWAIFLDRWKAGI